MTALIWKGASTDATAVAPDGHYLIGEVLDFGTLKRIGFVVSFVTNEQLSRKAYLERRFVGERRTFEQAKALAEKDRLKREQKPAKAVGGAS